MIKPRPLFINSFLMIGSVFVPAILINTYTAPLFIANIVLYCLLSLSFFISAKKLTSQNNALYDWLNHPLQTQNVLLKSVASFLTRAVVHIPIILIWLVFLDRNNNLLTISALLSITMSALTFYWYASFMLTLFDTYKKQVRNNRYTP